MSSKFFWGRLLGKGIEFEDYFENRDRKNLYVFLSALYDDEVFDYLQGSYAIAKLEAPTQEWVKLQVDSLIDKGVRF